MENTEKKNYNKKHSGFWSVVITLSVIMVLAVAVVITLIFAFPKTMGDFCYSMGFNEYACKLYNKDYEKGGDINSLYSSLNCAIKGKNDTLIISQFEKFYKNEEYYDFVGFIDNQNSKIQDTSLIKASLLNEDNYLKNNYVLALINKGQVQDAFNFALADGVKQEITYSNFGNYLFGNFVNETKGFIQSKFFDVLDGQTQPLKDELLNYFNSLYNEFKKQYTEVEEMYIIALGNRISYVGESINLMLKKVGQPVDENIITIVTEVNDNLADKLMH